MKTPHPIRSIRIRHQHRVMLPKNETALDRRRRRMRQKERRRRLAMAALIVMGALALGVVLPWLVWRGPYVIDAKYINRKALGDGSAALVTGLRTAIVGTVAALGASVALLYTARTYRLTRRGQITDRFTKALERLGSPEIYIRIGGILALEQIVQDAPEQVATDAARVLGHFIRHQAPRATADPDAIAVAPALPDEPAADVQAALTALTRPESRAHVDPREILDLHGLHLAGAHLQEADLTRVVLSKATLTGAYMVKATLTSAGLAEANLTRANLHGATLDEADLHQAILTDAHLNSTTMTDAILVAATLMRTHLVGATLTRAFLHKATLAHADLKRATLTDANLTETMLTDADLKGATLTGADLEAATLTRTDLRATTLTDTRSLTIDQAVSAITDEATQMPERFYASVNPPAAAQQAGTP
ncbi:pentapeptide repeat-containing protein [Streptomyces mirabilis]|uniref:pentapeptide repeat-containing protein n=1 Tax=Streptomyces mirabilis TaxID=68239 RepID=UPI0036E77DCD